MAESEFFDPLHRDAWPELFPRAKELRQHLTSAEEVLWECLRNNQLGFKFRRQHPIDFYIADFYCHEKSLVVELDGEIHLSQQEYDNHRTEVLQSIGIRVLRFSNDEVLDGVNKVIRKIKDVLYEP